MSGFIDDEASEASSSDEESPNQNRSKKSSKNKKSREVIDSSEEELEEDDEEAAEIMKELINDEEESEDEASSEDDEADNKRSYDEESSLEEDDIDLIQENTGVRIEKKKTYKRVKTILSDDESEDGERDEGKQIGNELFGNNDILDSDEDVANKQKSKAPDSDMDLNLESDESDSDDGFIVDDNDQPIHRKPKKKGSRYTDSAMQQAQEIFGVDLNDFEDEEADDEDEYEGYDEDDETGELDQSRKKKGRKTIYDVFEPSELQRSHMTAFDQQVRAKDEPERFQLRPVPVTEATDEELTREAEWIFQTAFQQKTISTQEEGREGIYGGKNSRSELIKPEIKYALGCIRNEKLEVPFISAYRKEYVPTISKEFDDTSDLWTIYKFDEQWCKLETSKKFMLNLYTDMKKYIEGMSEKDESIRAITETDLEQVHNISNFYELEDCRLHFKLYYSSLSPEMKLKVLKQKIDEQREKRANGTEKTTEENEEDEENEDAQSETEKHQQEVEETEEEKMYKKLSKFKISSSRDRYQKYRQEGAGGLVKKFGLTAEQFGENLRDDYQRNNVKQEYVRPLDEAANFLKPSSVFQTKDSILKAAMYMFTREVSCDPMVRQTVRRFYFDNSVINVKPTTLGMKEIDENHPCYSMKFLKNKPVSRLFRDQILNILSAEKDKLLEVKFAIEALDTYDNKNGMSPYNESLKALYYSDFSSIVTKEWNDVREESIKAAMEKYLLPTFEKQLRERLVKEAQDKIIKNSCEKLHSWLKVAPYSPQANTFDQYENFELREGIRICGFTFAPDGDAPCFAAIIDTEGELLDHVRLPYLNMRKRHDRMNALERENHAKDRIKFKQFIANRRPHVVALAAETIQTKYICQDLAQLLDELREHDGLPVIPIEIVDNELSNVYINLKRANEEFPEFPPLLLQAISNARKLNDPLTEYAKLCTADDDVLCIRFHHLQDDLPKEDFLNSLNQEFITRVNAVGVDPNRCIVHPHTADIVQFIAGLGPRKAAHLLRSIKKSSTGGQLVSRQQLVKELGMTSVIFINCAGFIKLDTDTLSDDFPDEHITPLDSTRIHPQSYGLAKKIASDALDYEEGASDEITANAIDEILETPEKLDELDLEAFATELDVVQKQGKKRYTLECIRKELQHRYQDSRTKQNAPSQDQIFAMLTKETPQTFYHGKLITCQVYAISRKKPGGAQLDMANPQKIEQTNLWRCPFCMRGDFTDLSVVWNHFDTDDCPGYAIGVKCRLDNGLFGFIPTKFVSDKDITDPAERVTIGQTIHARVLKIDVEKFSCELSCRTSDLVDTNNKHRPAKDEAYDEIAESAARAELEAKSRKTARRPYCKRVIVHPAFENIDYKACEKKLAEMEQGHAIIRPSSAGQNFLTVSWKVANGVNQHVNIREEGKDNAFSLGHQLFIEQESYEDLDEIIARYIQPMASFAREILNFKYCIPLLDGIEEEVTLQEKLFIEKRAAQCFPYRFIPSRKMPGKFLLGYIPKNKPITEYLTVTPKGYRFRKLYFKNLASLIKWFKENWNKMPQIYSTVTPAVFDGMSTNPLSNI